MGFAGAMVGLGKGLQDYSTILGEKQKQDWLTQKDQVMFEREKELNRLREAANMRVAEKTNEMREAGEESRFTRQQAAQIGSEEREDARWGERFGMQQEAAANQFEKQFGKEKELIGIRNQAELEQMDKKLEMEMTKAEKFADLALEKDTKKKQNIYNQFMSSPEAQKLSPEARDQYGMAILQPEVYKLINGSNQDTSMKKEMMETHSISYNKGLEAWDSVPEKQQKSWDKKAKAAGLPDGRFAYAEYVAGQSININGLLSEKKAPSKNTQSSFDAEQAKNIREALKSGSLSLKEAEEKTAGTAYESTVKDYKMNMRKTPSQGGALSSVVQGVVDFGSRNAPSNTNKLKELKERYPNMTDKFYQMKLEGK